MSKIDAILFSLLDGKWHNIAEFTNTLSIDRWKLEEIVKLLADFGFIRVDEREIRVTPETKEFLETAAEI